MKKKAEVSSKDMLPKNKSKHLLVMVNDQVFKWGDECWSLVAGKEKNESTAVCKDHEAFVVETKLSLKEEPVQKESETTFIKEFVTLTWNLFKAQLSTWLTYLVGMFSIYLLTKDVSGIDLIKSLSNDTLGEATLACVTLTFCIANIFYLISNPNWGRCFRKAEAFFDSSRFASLTIMHGINVCAILLLCYGGKGSELTLFILLPILGMIWNCVITVMNRRGRHIYGMIALLIYPIGEATAWMIERIQDLVA